MTAKPELIVFDLDYTLWPFWIDTHHDPPFTKDSQGKIRDGANAHVGCYRDVPDMLKRLYSEGYKIGIASRTTCKKEAQTLVNMFGWDTYIHYTEIYPDCKITHFKRFNMESKIDFKKMLFFDDEYRNIKDVSTKGVTCIHVENGMTEEYLKKGLAEFSKNNS